MADKLTRLVIKSLDYIGRYDIFYVYVVIMASRFIGISAYMQVFL